MANTTLSTLRSGTRSEFKLDRLGKVWSDPEVNDAINEGILEIQNKGDFKWKENEKTTTLSTVASQQEYDLSTLITDFITLDLVKYEGNAIDSTEYKTINALYTTFPEGTPNSYYLYGWQLWLNPIPTEVGVVDITYRGILDDLTSDSDESPFSTKFDKAIKLYASYVLLSKPWDAKNEQRARLKLDKFQAEVAKLMKTFLFQDRGQFQYKTTYTPRTSSYRRSRFINI
jgi:hypothetical protein